MEKKKWRLKGISASDDVVLAAAGRGQGLKMDSVARLADTSRTCFVANERAEKDIMAAVRSHTVVLS